MLLNFDANASITKEWSYDPCSNREHRWLKMKDEELQNQLGRLMLSGVLLAAAIMGVGLVWLLATREALPPGDHIFLGEPKYFENPISMIQRALEFREVGHRRSLIMIGVVLLLINPVVRVAFAAYGFAAQGDRLYTLISLVVFVVLLLSFFW
jgi:uncharacterized membrane protein